MRSVSRTFRLMLAVAVGLVMSVALNPLAASATTDQAAPPTAEATWHLSEYEQRICIHANGPHFTYFVGFLSGSWSTPLAAEVHDLPEGTVYEMNSSIPPGDNGDRYIGDIWILADLPPLDYGEYTAELVVTDGTVTQTMPIVVKAQEQWGC
jgi:hypothetical protein